MTIRPWINFALFSLPVLALGAVVAFLFVRSTDLDSSTETMMAGDRRGQEMLEVVGELLSEDVLAGILVERDDWSNPDGAHLSNAIVLELERVPGCVEVRSLTTTTYPGLENKKPILKQLLPLEVDHPSQWAERRAFLTSHPLSKNFILSEDGKLALFIGVYQRPMKTHAQREAFRQEIQRAIEPFRPVAGDPNDPADPDIPGLQIDIIGLELAQAEIVGQFLSDGKRYGIGFLLLASLFVLVVFRNPFIWLLLLGYLVFGLGVLAAVFWLNGHLPNLYTAILLPLVMGLQLTFLTHLFSAWQSRLKRGLAPNAALDQALREVLAPSLVAAITTVIGLVSLMLSPVEIVRSIGLFGAQAVALMFIGTFLPALVMRACNRPAKIFEAPSSRPESSRWFARKAPALLVIIAACVALPGLRSVKPDIRALEFIDPGTETWRAADLINRRMGGLYMFELSLEFDKPYGAQEVRMLKFQEALRREIGDIEGVGEAYGYSQIFTLLNYELKNGRADYSTLPGMLSMFLVKTTVNTFAFPYKSRLQNDDASRVSLFVRSADMPSKQYLGIIERVLEAAERLKPEGVTITPRNGVQSFLSGQQEIVDSLTRTLGVSLLAVFLCLCILWRSLRCGLAGLLVALPALIVMGGLMGYLDVSLNAVTVMLCALILGIAVDDAVHVIDLFRKQRHRFERSIDAAGWAVREKLQAMFCTTAILVSLFGLLALSSFPPVAAFGLLAAIALVTAFLSALFLLPALLALLYPRSV